MHTSLYCVFSKVVALKCHPFVVTPFTFQVPSKNCEKRVLASTRLSVRPSACYTSAPSGCIFINCLSIFRKSVEKSQVSLKSDKNNGYYTYQLTHVHDNISLNSS